MEVYFAGAKRCTAFCNIFIKWDGLYCPCCQMFLRSKPRCKVGSTIKKHNDSKRIGNKKSGNKKKSRNEPIMSINWINK